MRSWPLRRLTFLTISGALLGVAGVNAQPVVVRPPVQAGTIDRLDPALDRLIPIDVVVEKVAAGFQFTEGPLWVENASWLEDGNRARLLFSDIPANRVYGWRPGEEVTVVLDPVLAPDAGTGAVGGSNGLALDRNGRLLLFEHGNRRVARMEADGRRTTLADRYQGKRLNSPNDGVVHSSGALFFTDPPYGLPKQDEDPAKELGWNGVYRLDPEGELTLLARQSRPNGIGLSVDESTLYVANSDAAERVWMAYPVGPDLSLGEGRVFFDGGKVKSFGVPDGLAVDPRGNVWATGPGGVLVIDPAGRHLGTIQLEELPANAAFAEGGRYLFMTARTGLYRVRVTVSP